jgi:hypothetical protein
VLVLRDRFVSLILEAHQLTTERRQSLEEALEVTVAVRRILQAATVHLQEAVEAVRIRVDRLRLEVLEVTAS